MNVWINCVYECIANINTKINAENACSFFQPWKSQLALFVENCYCNSLIIIVTLQVGSCSGQGLRRVILSYLCKSWFFCLCESRCRLSAPDGGKQGQGAATHSHILCRAVHSSRCFPGEDAAVAGQHSHGTSLAEGVHRAFIAIPRNSLWCWHKQSI